MGHTQQHIIEGIKKDALGIKSTLGTLAETEEKARVSRQGQQGFDVFGDPVDTKGDPSVFAGSGAQSQEIISRYTGDDSGPIREAGKLFEEGGIFSSRTLPTAEDEAGIREGARAEVQAQIDAINELAGIELAEATERGRERLGRGRAVSAATGVLGSPAGDAKRQKITDVNVVERDKIRAAQAADVSAILTGVENRSREIIQQRKTEATTNAQAFIDFLSATAEDARADMTSLATAGAELSSTQRSTLIEQTGYDPETFDALYKSLRIANSPDVINKDKPIINEAEGKLTYIMQVIDPETGAVSFATETIDIPKTVQGKKVKSTVTTADGIQILFEDGTYSKIGDVPVKDEDDKDSIGAEFRTERAQRTLDSVSSLKVDAEDNPGIFGKTAAFPFPDAVRTEAFRNFEAELKTLKASIAFGELTAMREASKTGGALGQVSNIELGLLESALGALSMTQSPENFVEELDKIAASIERWKGAVGGTDDLPTDEEVSNAQSAEIGTTVILGGVSYKKTGEDDYTPI